MMAILDKHIRYLFFLLELISKDMDVNRHIFSLFINSVTDNFKFIIWILSYKICDVFAKKVNLIKICTVRHIRINIIHGNQNVFSVLTWVGRILSLAEGIKLTNILPTHVKTQNTCWLPWIILIPIYLTVQIH